MRQQVPHGWPPAGGEKEAGTKVLGLPLHSGLTVADVLKACSLGWGLRACPGRSSPTLAHAGPSASC